MDPNEKFAIATAIYGAVSLIALVTAKFVIKHEKKEKK